MKHLNMIILILVFLTFCGSYSLINYNPQAMQDIEEAKLIIEKTTKLQPEPYKPSKVTVTDDQLQIIADFRAGYHIQRKKYLRKKTFVFKDIKEVKLIKERNVFRVTFLSHTDRMILHIYVPDEYSAKKYMDAVYTMIIKNKS